ncbi:PhzF family phenazine biosynthesis protein [Sinisalibacter aestuarii]|uniref:Phenazine antibiotic biosynthesis-like protein n=1 Tax=Sinisalibacter aestuarii TaxID=2949426 RepID=A0ABQ5LRA4_9RHOB|nr:PhzF family phenazine biosynthesis protein [Sinisalibacter aestuarii]GKY87539.1 phenazine antibiotic biosynthesis-like protein [Sinisalibacter aestuarii]
MTGYLVYDVFTDRRYGGNQLAILPDARDLPEAELQLIAQEFNFSETVFLYPPDKPGHDARIRIFTPTMELPFAGHPTIGTAVMLGDAGLGPDLVLELGIGPLNARVEGSRASFTTGMALKRLAAPETALVADALGIAAGEIAARPVMATLGLGFTFTPLVSRAALAACSPDIAAFRRGAEAHPEGMDFAQYAYVEDGNTIHARMFAPLDNIPEDPATGSAAATLAALLAEMRGAPVALTIRQGEDMGRPSLIEASATPGGPVTVSGEAVPVTRGELLR